MVSEFNKFLSCNFVISGMQGRFFGISVQISQIFSIFSYILLIVDTFTNWHVLFPVNAIGMMISREKTSKLTYFLIDIEFLDVRSIFEGLGRICEKWSEKTQNARAAQKKRGQRKKSGENYTHILLKWRILPEYRIQFNFQELFGSSSSRIKRCIVWIWKNTFARLGEDWVYLALLGIIMALLSFIMDKGISMCTNGN